MNFYFLPTLSLIFQQVLPSNTCFSRLKEYVNIALNASWQRTAFLPYKKRLSGAFTGFWSHTARQNFTVMFEVKPAHLTLPFRMDFATCRVCVE